MPQDGEYTKETFFFGNCEVIVYRPILDEETRKKREKTLERALAEYGRAMVRNQTMKGDA